MSIYVSKDVDADLLDVDEFVQYAIDLSDESIENLRRDLDELKK